MSSIDIFLYSYKNKNLLSYCLGIKEKIKSPVNIYLCDQNNINRDYQFKDIENIFYRHVKWDDRKGMPFLREEFMRYSKSNFIISMTDKANFSKEWDIKDYMPDDYTILSGNSLVALSSDKFFIVEKKEQCSEQKKIMWIDNNFIFLTKKNANILFNEPIVKYHGDNLLMSLKAIKNNLEIFSLPSDLLQINYFDENKYVCYSRYHGYNTLIKSINKKIKDGSLDKDILFNNHNIDIQKLNPLPFDTDDVPYHEIKITLDQGSDTRFHYRLTKITI